MSRTDYTRTRKPAMGRTDEQVLVQDMKELTESVRGLAVAVEDQARALQPLADKAPEILRIVEAWEAGHSIGRGFVFMGNAVKWSGMVAIGVAALWAVFKGKFLALLGNSPG